MNNLSINAWNNTTRVLSETFKSLNPQLLEEEKELLSRIRNFSQENDVISKIENDLLQFRFNSQQLIAVN